MASEKGRYFRQSLSRKWIADMLHFAKRVPVVAAERELRIRAAAEARKAGGLAIGWNTIIVKAIAMASMRVPELRQAYIPYPWPRLYEAPYSVCSIVLNREFQGQQATFMAPMLYPERYSLVELQAKLERLKTAPLHEVGAFRRLIRNTRFPLPIRRLFWSLGLNWLGLFRARTFGTFAVNSVAALRGRMLTMTTPITSCFYYGSVSRAGEMVTQIAFDHRVFDGYHAAVIGAEVEKILNNEIAAELASLREAQRAAA